MPEITESQKQALARLAQKVTSPEFASAHVWAVVGNDHLTTWASPDYIRENGVLRQPGGGAGAKHLRPQIAKENAALAAAAVGEIVQITSGYHPRHGTTTRMLVRLQ